MIVTILFELCIDALIRLAGRLVRIHVWWLKRNVDLDFLRRWSKRASYRAAEIETRHYAPRRARTRTVPYRTWSRKMPKDGS